MAGAAVTPPNPKLARQQLDLAQRALADLEQLAKSGEVGFGSPMFSLWENRRIEALRASGAPKAEVIKVLEKSLDALKYQVQLATKAHQSGQIGRYDLMDVQYRRLEAEARLNAEKAR
jgi:outer membrane protein TolC